MRIHTPSQNETVSKYSNLYQKLAEPDSRLDLVVFISALLLHFYFSLIF